MALSYSAFMRVPKSYTLTSLSTFDFFEFTGGGGGGYPSIVSILTSIKASYEGLYGGTMSWVITDDATFFYYTITWDGLTSDPAIGVTGNPVALQYADDITGEMGGFQWTYADICPCPPSVDPADATDCLTCYEATMDFCDASFDIEGLSPSLDYSIEISDNLSGASYSYPVTADAFGIAEIITADFPSGAFTPFNSPLTVSVLDEDGNPVVLTYGYINYSCISLTVLNVSTIT